LDFIKDMEKKTLYKRVMEEYLEGFSHRVG